MAKQKIFTKIGDKVNDYTIISDPFYDKEIKKIKVKCKCGQEKAIYFSNLRQSKSCKLCFGASKHKFKTGDIVGNFEVIEYVFIPETCKSKIKIRCQCKEEYLVKSDQLGKNKVCKKCNPKAFSINSKFYQGTINIPKTYFTSIKLNAKRKNRDFDLDIEYLEELFIKQNKKCAYSGLLIELNGKNKESTASLDRINSLKGYTKGNVQWVHKTVNRMKTDLSEKEFLFFVNNIYKERKNELE